MIIIYDRYATAREFYLGYAMATPISQGSRFQGIASTI
jgi:hypothetical protein